MQEKPTVPPHFSLEPLDHEIAALVDYVRTRTGMTIEREKRYFLDSRLSQFLRIKRIPTLRALLEKLKAPGYDPIHREIVNALMIHETFFFRDEFVYQSLQEIVLPNIVERRQADRTFNIWCAACSTGQEPYSLALMLTDAFPQLSHWAIRIVATDISNDALAIARAGRYSQMEVNRGLPPHLLARYFKPEGPNWVIDRRVADRVEFLEANVLEPFGDLPPVDLILVRNVLIYFDAETKKRAFTRIRRALRPDGHLLLGSSETTLGHDDAFTPVHYGSAVFYRNRDHLAKSPKRFRDPA